MIIEYMMWRNKDGLCTPSWVEDGGHFYNSNNNSYIGWSPALPSRKYYIPDSVEVLTKDELCARQIVIGMRDIDGEHLSAEDIREKVNFWYDVKSKKRSKS